MPRIIFDTTGINALKDGGAASEPLLNGLACGFQVILTGMNADELIATPTAAEREALLSLFNRLLGSAKCIWPPHEVIRLLVSAHCSNPPEFDWMKVDVRAHAYEVGLTRRDLSNEICTEQRTQQFKLENDFKKKWKGLRPKLDRVLRKEPSKRPNDYREAAAIAVRDNGVLWGLGQAMYKYVSRKEPTEVEIKSFMDVCPPFRAACYGLVMAWYNWSLRVQDGKKQADKAGRNDLMMATYLPYCDRFISNDWPQRKNLHDLAAEAKIDCEILSFNDFDQSFALVV